MPATAGPVLETSLQSLQRGRRRGFGLCVAPVKDSGRLLLCIWTISRGAAVGAAGDLAGKAFGLIPLVSSCGIRSHNVVEMQVPDASDPPRLVRAVSPARVIPHRHARYVSINHDG